MRQYKMEYKSIVLKIMCFFVKEEFVKGKLSNYVYIYRIVINRQAKQSYNQTIEQSNNKI